MSNEDLNLVQAIEALLFASPEPLSAARISKILADLDVSLQTVEDGIVELNRQYDLTCRAFCIMNVAGGYRLMTRSELTPIIARLNPPKKIKGLTDAAMETLAVIAYNQPLPRSKMDAIRGVNSEGALRTLLDRNMVESAGRSEDIGRPLLYRTTDEFLKYFNLSSIDDLPRDKDFPTTSQRDS